MDMIHGYDPWITSMDIQCAAERRTRHRAWPKTYTNNNKSIKQLSTFNPKSIKKQPKIYIKNPLKNRSQIHQKMAKHRSKIKGEGGTPWARGLKIEAGREVPHGPVG